MADENNGGVTISNAVIYAELLGVKEAVTKMSNQAAQLSDHETRLRSVERWKYALPVSIVTSTTAIVIAIMETKK